MNKTDKLVLVVIEYFDDRHVSRENLCTLTFREDRTVRNSIHRLRNAGHHIISDSSQSGYWMAKDDDEWNDFCDRERAAALNRPHRKTWENGRQLKIVEVDG